MKSCSYSINLHLAKFTLLHFHHISSFCNSGDCNVLCYCTWKYWCLLLLFVLEFVMNHKNETGNITTEKSFSTEIEKLVRAINENNWKIHVGPSFIEPLPSPPPRDKPTRVLGVANDITSLKAVNYRNNIKITPITFISRTDY